MQMTYWRVYKPVEMKLKKSEYLLNHATRLEELGQLKEATAAKDKASELFLKHEELLTSAGLKREQLDKQVSEGRLDREGRVDVANINAAGSKRDFSQMTGTSILAAKTEAIKQANALVATGEDDEYNNATTGKAKLDRVKTIADELMVVQGIRNPPAEQPKAEQPKTAKELEDEKFMARRKSEKK